MDKVLQLTEQVERLRQHIGASLPKDAEAIDALEHIQEALSGLDDAAERIMAAADEIKAAVPSTADHAETVNKAYFSIIEACSFHDLTCQRLTKIRKTLESMNDGLGKIRPFVSSDAELPPAQETADIEPIDEDAALLNGPSHEGEGVSQDDIDKMF